MYTINTHIEMLWQHGCHSGDISDDYSLGYDIPQACAEGC